MHQPREDPPPNHCAQSLILRPCPQHHRTSVFLSPPCRRQREPRDQPSRPASGMSRGRAALGLGTQRALGSPRDQPRHDADSHLFRVLLPSGSASEFPAQDDVGAAYPEGDLASSSPPLRVLVSSLTAPPTSPFTATVCRHGVRGSSPCRIIACTILMTPPTPQSPPAYGRCQFDQPVTAVAWSARPPTRQQRLRPIGSPGVVLRAMRLDGRPPVGGELCLPARR